MDAADDPTVARYRRQITDTDLAILEAVNRRIKLVAALHAHKREQGHDLIDPAREELLLAALKDANSGPLSDRQVAELHRLLLNVCRTAPPAPEA